MKNCPQCDEPISVLKIHSEFSCPHCGSRLKSNVVFANAVVVLPAVVIALLFALSCEDSKFSCYIIAKVVLLIPLYFLLYKRLLAIQHERKQETPG